MLKYIHLSALAVILLATGGCQTGQYQAATAPSVGPGETREAYCRQEAYDASRRVSSSNTARTAGSAIVGGALGYAVGRNVSHHGSTYRGAGTAIGATTGAVVGGSMNQSTQAAYDVAYTNCMNRR